MSKHVGAAALIAASLTAGNPATATPVATIQRVVVYSKQARVFREARVTLGGKGRRLRLASLPAAVVPGTVQVECPTARIQRVEMDAVTHAERPCDLSPFVHAGRGGRTSGYFLQFGGSGNTFNSLRRGGEYVACKCVKRFIQRGKVHKLVAEFDGAEVRLTVDGTVVLEYLEPRPLLGKGHDHLGIYIYKAGAVDNIKVFTAAQ